MLPLYRDSHWCKSDALPDRHWIRLSQTVCPGGLSSKWNRDAPSLPPHSCNRCVHSLLVHRYSDPSPIPGTKHALRRDLRTLDGMTTLAMVWSRVAKLTWLEAQICYTIFGKPTAHWESVDAREDSWWLLCWPAIQQPAFHSLTNQSEWSSFAIDLHSCTPIWQPTWTHRSRALQAGFV